VRVDACLLHDCDGKSSYRTEVRCRSAIGSCDA
jgi:hypothetical protein